MRYQKILLMLLFMCSFSFASIITSPGYFSPSANLLTFDEFSDMAELSYLGGVSFSSESSSKIGSPDYTDPFDTNNRFDVPMLTLHAVSGGGVPVSPFNYIAGPIHHGLDVSDMRLDFDNPQKAVGMWIIDNDFSDVRIRAFNSAGVLIETVYISEVSEGGFGFYGIASDTVDISYLIIDEQNGGAMDSTFIDNLYYEIPEPATLLLLGMGGLLTRKRK